MDDHLRSALRRIGSSEEQLRDDQRQRIDQRVREAMREEPTPLPGRSAPTTGRRAWYVAAGAVAATIALVVLVLGTRDPETELRGAPTSADELVQLVRASPTADWLPGDVLRQRRVRTSRETSMGEAVPEAVTTFEVEVHYDGRIDELTSDEVVSTGSGTSIVGTGAQVSYERFEGPGIVGLTREQVLGLPQDPTRLAEEVGRLRAIDPVDDVDVMIVTLADLSTMPTTPAPVRAAALDWILSKGFEVLTPSSEDELQLSGRVRQLETHITYALATGTVTAIVDDLNSVAFSTEVVSADGP